MKFKAIGGSWDGLMIGFDGERTENYFRTHPKEDFHPADGRVDPEPRLPATESYTLRSIIQVMPTDRRDGAGVINKPTGGVTIYIHSSLCKLDDIEVFQLLIDQHRPADKQER